MTIDQFIEQLRQAPRGQWRVGDANHFLFTGQIRMSTQPADVRLLCPIEVVAGYQKGWQHPEVWAGPWLAGKLLGLWREDVHRVVIASDNERIVASTFMHSMDEVQIQALNTLRARLLEAVGLS